jgi:hypothetical protein
MHKFLMDMEVVIVQKGAHVIKVVIAYALAKPDHVCVDQIAPVEK